MPRKKKNLRKDEVFTYKIEVMPVYKPSVWKAGEWIKNKESIGGYEFTGEEIREQLGYQLAVMCFVNGEELGVCEAVPNGYQTEKKIFKTEQDALEYLKWYSSQYTDLTIGNVFSPFVDRYKDGEVVK